MIKFTEVNKKFGKRAILCNVNFTLPEIGLVGLFGRSGSGKTTILKMIKEFEKPTKGKIECTVPNQDIIFLNQSIDNFDSITLIFYFKMLGLDNEEEIQRLLDKFLLSSKKEQKINTLSNGEKKRLQIITAIFLKPKILLLDEPFSGLDETTIQLIIPSLVELSKSILVIISTHQEKENMPFQIILEVKRKKVTFVKKENINLTANEKVNKITSKGFQHFFFYLWKKSMNVIEAIYLCLIAIFYSLGIVGASLDHFDRYAAAEHYYQDEKQPIWLKAKNYNSNSHQVPLLEYEQIKKCPYPIVSILPLEENNFSLDYIGVVDKNLNEDEVILSSSLKKANVKTINWEGKEYRIRSDFDFGDVKMLIFSHNYTQKIEKNIEVKGQDGNLYQIQILETLSNNQIILPTNSVGNKLYQIETNEYYQLPYTNVQIVENEENIIYVSKVQYENFFDMFVSKGHLFIEQKQIDGFINYMRHTSFDFADEQTIQLLNELSGVSVGKTSLSYSLIMISTIGIVVLFFKNEKHIDQQIVEREYQYLALKGLKKRVETTHLFIHIFYIIFSFLLANLLRCFIFAFRKKNVVLKTFYYIASPFALKRILIVFIFAALLSFFYFYLKKRIKGYSYLNSLKKDDE